MMMPIRAVTVVVLISAVATHLAGVQQNPVAVFETEASFSIVVGDQPEMDFGGRRNADQASPTGTTGPYGSESPAPPIEILGAARRDGASREIQAVPGKPAAPVEPITGILEMFKTHDVVALSEGSHGNEQGHAFRLALIRDPRFAATVNDIVVEFGNALYQDVIDRFVQGEPVAYEQLRKVWQDTTQRGTVWDRPIYEAFYRAVREVNSTLPIERRLRVLLGDPPIDWQDPQGRGTRRTDDFPVSVIQREVIGKKRRALVIYGGMHLIRKRTPFLPPSDPALAPMAAMVTQLQEGSIVAQLDRLGARVFVVTTSTDFDISTLQADIVNWARPSLAFIRGTPLGLESSVTYYAQTKPVIRGRGGISETLQPDVAAAPPMQEVVDAILYLGPPSAITHSRLLPELCADPAYVKMRLERLTEFAADGPASMFRAECAAVMKQH